MISFRAAWVTGAFGLPRPCGLPPPPDFLRGFFFTIATMGGAGSETNASGGVGTTTSSSSGFNGSGSSHVNLKFAT